MAARDAAWIEAHAGATTPRRMSAWLGRIQADVGRAVDDLAVTRVSKRQDPFHVLVATIISLRTKDEVTAAAAARLLEVAPTPGALAGLDEGRIAERIFPAGFYKTKAKTLRALGATLVREHGGAVPDTLGGLLALKGVGRKTANLVLTLGHGKPGICVDVHVHRISNRLGFVETEHPDDTERVLRARLPRRWWIPINDVLVAFGQRTCTPVSPWCSRCPVAGACPQVGVGRTR